MPNARDNAQSLYLDGIRDGRPREVVERCTGERYTQHSTGVKDGKDGFVEFFDDFIERNPDRDIRLVHSLQDGPRVFIHAHQSLNQGEQRWVTMDFFDSDAAGRIVEHWDVIAPGRAEAIGVGSTVIEDKEHTEANKALVRNFVSTVLIGRSTVRLEDFLDADYRQHEPDRDDGRDAFDRFYADEACPLSYQERVLLVGEGNFVATLSRARDGDQDLCQADLFRLTKGRIVEHWRNAEPVPPREEWVNSGKF